MYLCPQEKISSSALNSTPSIPLVICCLCGCFEGIFIEIMSQKYKTFVLFGFCHSEHLSVQKVCILAEKKSLKVFPILYILILLSVCLFVCPFYVHYTCLSVCLFVCPFFDHPTCLSVLFLFIHLLTTL